MRTDGRPGSAASDMTSASMERPAGATQGKGGLQPNLRDVSGMSRLIDPPAGPCGESLRVSGGKLRGKS